MDLSRVTRTVPVSAFTNTGKKLLTEASTLYHLTDGNPGDVLLVTEEDRRVSVYNLIGYRQEGEEVVSWSFFRTGGSDHLSEWVLVFND